MRLVSQGSIEAKLMVSGLLLPTAVELRDETFIVHWLLARDGLAVREHAFTPAQFRSAMIEAVRPSVSDDVGTEYRWVSGGMGGPAEVAPAVWPGWSRYEPRVASGAGALRFCGGAASWTLRLT